MSTMPRFLSRERGLGSAPAEAFRMRPFLVQNWPTSLTRKLKAQKRSKHVKRIFGGKGATDSKCPAVERARRLSGATTLITHGPTRFRSGRKPHQRLRRVR